VPGIQICIPGHPVELDTVLKDSIEDDKPYYIRLGEVSNKISARHQSVYDGDCNKNIAIFAVGNIVDKVRSATDQCVIYINRIPTGYDFVNIVDEINKIIIVEPYYPVLHNEFIKAIKYPVSILNIGVPRQFIHEYGKISDIDQVTGLSVAGIRKQIEEFLNG
jgi:deoxyxylulose-5-phosphate synthase